MKDIEATSRELDGFSRNEFRDETNLVNSIPIILEIECLHFTLLSGIYGNYSVNENY